MKAILFQLVWQGVLAVIVVRSGACLGSEEPDPLALVGPRPKPVETPSAETIDESIRRGVDFLLDRQNPNGSWGSAQNTKDLNIFAPVPGAHHAFRTATTALCLSALIQCGDPRKEADEAIERGEAWFFERLPKLRRATPSAIYNNWAHAYAIAALADLYQRHPKDEKRREAIQGYLRQQLDMLKRYECVDGGWAYYDFVAQTQKPSGSSISFVTATVLVALADARPTGLEPPEKLIQRAMDSIRRQRKPDFSYCYGEYLKYRPMRGINRPGGSVGRSQNCNLAMYLWHDEQTTLPIMRAWLDRLFARQLWLDIGRKRPIPHESWFQVAGYFFYFGHYYAARCIDQLDPRDRGPYQDQLAQVLLARQEKDGSWWDYPLYDYHQQYGTAFAVMSLARCRRGNGSQGTIEK